MTDLATTSHPFAPDAAAGQIALVTGASSGIGRASARLLAATGWTVYVAARRTDRLEELAAEAQDLSGQIIPLPLDVTDPEAVQQAARWLLAETGGQLQALVNISGGALGLDTVGEGKLEDWQAMYQLNVLGTLNMVKAFLPALRASGAGSILNLTSTAAEAGYEGGGGYNASKFGQRALTEALRLEEAEHGVRVIEIRPGMVATEEFSLKRLGSQQAAEAVYAGVAKPLLAEDVAQTVAFALNLPHHINIDHLTVRPLAQAAQYKVIREF